MAKEEEGTHTPGISKSCHTDLTQTSHDLKHCIVVMKCSTMLKERSRGRSLRNAERRGKNERRKGEGRTKRRNKKNKNEKNKKNKRTRREVTVRPLQS
jgi:hypothetical protein